MSIWTDEQLAYACEVSRQIGFEVGVATVHTAGHDAARIARTTWKHPRHDEIERRREADHEPCPASRRHPCRCSRCMHAWAWQRRGGRDFLGIEVEAQLVMQMWPELTGRAS